MPITILKHGAPWGPFTRAQIEDGLARGDFTLESLAHSPGLTNWRPLREVLEQIAARPVLPPLPAPPEPPMATPRTGATSRPPPLTAAPSARPVAPPLVAAGLIERSFALLLDLVLVFAPLLLVLGAAAAWLGLSQLWDHGDGESHHQDWLLFWRNGGTLLLLVATGFSWIYSAFFESSRAQGTPGKSWMRLKVTDLAGEPISFLRATGRLLGKYFSALLLPISLLMSFASRTRRAPHDLLAGTRVVRR